MSTAISVYHGAFGRAAIYHLDRPLTLHAHREGHLVFYIDRSTGVLTVNGAPQRCDAARAVAVNPWEVHNFQPSTPGAGTICLVLYIRPQWFTRHGAAGGASTLRFGRSEIPLDAEMLKLVDLVAHRLQKAGEDEEFDHGLFALTNACYCASVVPGNTLHDQTPAAPSLSDFRIRKSIQIMQSQLSTQLDMDGVARESGLSRPHFFKLFRLQTGLTPHLYMNTLRVETAINMVTGTERSVTDIGLDLGFSSQSSFTRFFSLNVGLPPTDYRRVAQVAA